MSLRKPIPSELNEISGKIVNAAFEVHSNLGPGLIESVYEVCLAQELEEREINFERQKTLPIQYKNNFIDDALRIDLLIENKVIVELKAVENILPVHEAQLLTYLKLSKCRLGLLINFNVPLLKNGIKRIVL
jgi:GxxExxY protein